MATNTGPGGWAVCGIAGNGGHPIRRGITWLNLGCQYFEGGFRAGGWVEDAGQQIVAVRLVDLSGVVLEDRVENQVALFRSYRPVTFPVTVHLIDATDLIAATHHFP